jgi:2,4-dienoyl-CoA reductase-like NADH-dependent reductase (Old Yellow Enzyme family)
MEYVLWATAFGAEDWDETIITTITTEDIKEAIEKFRKAKAWAQGQGFRNFRVQCLSLDQPEEVLEAFKKAVNL